MFAVLVHLQTPRVILYRLVVVVCLRFQMFTPIAPGDSRRAAHQGYRRGKTAIGKVPYVHRPIHLAQEEHARSCGGPPPGGKIVCGHWRREYRLSKSDLKHWSQGCTGTIPERKGTGHERRTGDPAIVAVGTAYIASNVRENTGCREPPFVTQHVQIA